VNGAAYAAPMGNDAPLVRITAGDVRPALELAEPEPDHGSKKMAVTLDFMEKEPSGLGKMFGSKGVGLSVEVHAFEPGGPHHYFSDVDFPRRVDIQQAFRRTSLEWPVWWVIDDVSHLIDKRSFKRLSVSGFGMPEYVLPWFVRLHAVVTETDPFAPVIVRRTVSKIPEGGIGDGRHIDSLGDFMHEVAEDMRREATDEHLKQTALEEWRVREAEWKRSTGQA
jgi:hypothetical protein